MNESHSILKNKIEEFLLFGLENDDLGGGESDTELDPELFFSKPIAIEQDLVPSDENHNLESRCALMLKYKRRAAQLRNEIESSSPSRSTLPKQVEQLSAQI